MPLLILIGIALVLSWEVFTAEEDAEEYLDFKNEQTE